MTARELIEKLKTFPPETLVVVDGYEGGVKPPGEISEIGLKLDVHTGQCLSYYGPHEQEDDPAKADARAVYLPR